MTGAFWEVLGIVAGGILLHLITSWRMVGVVKAEFRSQMPWIKGTLDDHSKRIIHLEHKGEKS